MRTFEATIAEWEKYVRRVAYRCSYQSPLYGEEDLYQELSLAIWKCVEHYQDLPANAFTGVVIRTINNTLSSCLRRRRSKERWRAMSEHNNASRTEVSEIYYRVGIETLEAPAPVLARVRAECGEDVSERKTTRRRAFAALQDAL